MIRDQELNYQKEIKGSYNVSFDHIFIMIKMRCYSACFISIISNICSVRVGLLLDETVPSKASRLV